MTILIPPQLSSRELLHQRFVSKCPAEVDGGSVTRLARLGGMDLFHLNGVGAVERNPEGRHVKVGGVIHDHHFEVGVNVACLTSRTTFGLSGNGVIYFLSISLLYRLLCSCQQNLSTNFHVSARGSARKPHAMIAPARARSVSRASATGRSAFEVRNALAARNTVFALSSVIRSAVCFCQQIVTSRASQLNIHCGTIIHIPILLSTTIFGHPKHRAAPGQVQYSTYLGLLGPHLSTWVR